MPNGDGDRDHFWLHAGQNTVRRPFTVPADLPVGTYEIAAELWPAGKIGGNGVETLTDNPCRTIDI